VTTRAGGISPPPWRGLNLSEKTGDSIERVTENWRRVTEAVGSSPRLIALPQQVHGAAVVVVDGLPRGAANRRLVPETDALVTTRTDIALAAVGADCPLGVLYDPTNRVLGVFHSGWRGTLDGIGASVVDVMREHFGCRNEDIVAALSPSIGPCCYEVGGEFRPPVRDSSRDIDNCLALRDGKLYFDLWAANEVVLKSAGLNARNIETARMCTCCQSADFYSHRASGASTGRHALIAYLEGASE